MSDPTKNESGSLWRRWDLHLHTPGTKLNNAFGEPTDSVWTRYIDILEQSPVQAFGITDYFSCDAYFDFTDRYKKRHPKSAKCFFPNLEFRLSESISKDGGHPNIHVIFDNDVALCGASKLIRFLTNLDTQAIDNANTKKKCSDLSTRTDFESATVSLDDLIGALKETFGDSTPYLIAFPANNDGVRSTDTTSPRKVALADRIDKSPHLFFGTEKNSSFFLRTDRYSTGQAQPKPVVSGSDAHSFTDLERLTGDVPGFPSTWIKADTTFRGLVQILYEPQSRVYIGPTPDVITRQDRDRTKFLQTLSIDQVADYDEQNGLWFKGVRLPLNPELTAIIGNKGSGKSALVDILGLLGESRQEKHFSFLTNRHTNRKFRQPGFAENFTASVTWLSGRRHEKRLSDLSDTEKPEGIRYLPQNYFEHLTNELEIEQFRQEIEEVVFSHVEEPDRLGKSSFSELEDYKTAQSKRDVSNLKQQLRALNLEIVKLEERRSPAYRRQLEARLTSKQQELDAIHAAKPQPVSKPTSDSPEQLALNTQVESQTALLTTLGTRVTNRLREATELKARLQNANLLKDSITSIKTKLENDVNELQSKLTDLGIHIDQIINFSISLQPLEDKIAELQASVAALEKDNGLSFDSFTAFDTLTTLPDLRTGYSFCKEGLDHLKRQLTAPHRRYQAFIDQTATWDEKRLGILGDDEDPKPDTINYLKADLTYVTTALEDDLQARYLARRKLVQEIFQSKHTVLDFYGELRKSVEGQLQSGPTDGFELEIDASFVVDRGFRREFLNHVDQRRRGPFRNDHDAQRELGHRVEGVEWNNCNAVVAFCEDLIETMRTHDGQELAIADQVHDVKSLYDYVFSLDYLTARYQLRLGGKTLNELSPGEKGLLLLIFYLQLDQQNIPLVIDQPEDNLDNDSIFKVLAACIRAAKCRRQVILVTHNPNLAVGADAEQVIHVQLDKAANYKFSYESGALENPRLNRRIIDVLEGSQPAFVKRRLKYGI